MASETITMIFTGKYNMVYVELQKKKKEWQMSEAQGTLCK